MSSDSGTHLDISIHRHNAITLPADGENRGLRRVDDCSEAVRTSCTEVRDADRRAVELFALQSTLEGALDTIRAPASEFQETKPLNVVNHRNEQTVFDGNHQADVRTARLDQTSIGRVWISRKSRVHGRKIAECSSDCLQQEIVHRQLARARRQRGGRLRTQRLQQGPVDRAFDDELRDGRVAQCHRARQCAAHRRHPSRRRAGNGRRFFVGRRSDRTFHIFELNASARPGSRNAAEIEAVLGGHLACDWRTSDAISGVRFECSGRRQRGLTFRCPRLRDHRACRLCRIGFEACDLIADARLLAHLHQDLDQAPAHRRLDFNHRFFRFDFDQRFSERHRIAHVLEPASDADRLHHEADFRYFHRNQCHGSLLLRRCFEAE